MKTLGATIFVRDAFKFDYCLRESIECLKELCDEVIVVDAGSQDGTTDLVKSLADRKTNVICCENDEWLEKQKQLGEKVLAYYTNFAASFLTTQWHYNQQADEVLHEDCFADVRMVVQLGMEGFWCRRYNLWGTSQYFLDVEAERKPVGDIVLRLAKTGYQSVEDAQSLHVPDAQWDYLNKIRIYHMGFVRNPYIEIKKVEYMLTNVFTYGQTDPKVAAMGDKFKPYDLFSKEDCKPIIEPLPKFVQEWAKQRDKLLIDGT